MIRDETTCSVCGAPVEDRAITFTQTVGERVFLVTDVPALVCRQCGEQYLTPDTVDAIQKIVERRRTTRTIEVPVYAFEASR